MPAHPPPAVPLPSVFRRIWVPGLQYLGETPRQMAERERIFRAEDALATAEQARLLAWKLRPWWQDHANS